MYKSGAPQKTMSVNAEKTKVMLVITYQRETKLQTLEIKVNFNNTMLENVNSEKLLGVIIDKHLSWKQQFCLLKHSVKTLPS